MKNCLFFGLLMALAACGETPKQEETNHETKPEGYTITGSNFDDGTMIYLSEYDGYYPHVIDSCLVENGNFKFEGKTHEPIVHMLSEDASDLAKDFFLENASFEVQPGFEITGGNLQIKFAEFDKAHGAFNDDIRALEEQFGEAKEAEDTAAQSAIEAEYMAIDSERSVIINNAITDNKDNLVGLYVYVTHNMFMDDYTAVVEMDELFAEEVKISKYYAKMAAKMHKLAAFEPGNEAPDFKLPSVKGDSISRSDYNGKVLLLDFWASWCGPCRQLNPEIVALYEDFHGKGLEILGVSLDDNAEKWKAAIEKDGLPWAHVSDLIGWESVPGQLYGIDAIPHTFLIDEEGKFIVHGVEPDSIRTILEERMN